MKPLGQEHSKYPGLFSQSSLQPDIPSVHSLISTQIANMIKIAAVLNIVYIIFLISILFMITIMWPSMSINHTRF